MKLNMYSDSGHAWLKVSKKMLIELGIANKISTYSYQRGSYAYLEEDCDFPLFAKAYKAINKTLEVIEHHTDRQSKIRNYDSYFFSDFLTNHFSPFYNFSIITNDSKDVKS